MAAAPVGQTGDPDRPEQAAQRPGVPGLDIAVPVAVGIEHLQQALFAQRAQVEVALQHLAQQLPAPGIELLFQLPVLQPGCLLALQPADQLLETLPRRSHRLAGRRDARVGDAHGRPPRPGLPARLLRSRASPAAAQLSSSACADWYRSIAAATTSTSSGASVIVLVRPDSV